MRACGYKNPNITFLYAISPFDSVSKEFLVESLLYGDEPTCVHMEIKLIFTFSKAVALGLGLKQGQKATQKWSICHDRTGPSQVAGSSFFEGLCIMALGLV